MGAPKNEGPIALGKEFINLFSIQIVVISAQPWAEHSPAFASVHLAAPCVQWTQSVGQRRLVTGGDQFSTVTRSRLFPP